VQVGRRQSALESARASRARERVANSVNWDRFRRSFSAAAAAALREREQAPPLSVLQIFRSVVDDPVGRAAPAPADIIIINRPDRPSSIVAPNRNLPTTIREKEMSTSASSRSAAEAAGAGRSASERAGIGARLARAREDSE
jgi:hypothetical protein